MQYKPFKELNLSRLGLGNMRLPTIGDDPAAPIDRERAYAIVDYAMENGINYYDTAWVYHHSESESFLGDALKKYPRESYHIATKFLLMANPDYKFVFEEQLRRLQTDYIDFYLMHGINDDSWEAYRDSGCIEYFNEQRRLGRIKHLGFSSHAKPENLAKFIELNDWEFVQIQLNYLDWNVKTAKEEYDIITAHNIPVMVMEPVHGGKLASIPGKAGEMLKNANPDWSPATWAIRWVMSLDNVQVMLSGMSNLDQIKENVATADTFAPLTEEQKNIVNEVAKAFHADLTVPCTGCRYCCDDCPQSIEIPSIMSIYNEHKLGDFMALNDLALLPKTPSDCIGCGSCEAHCPQHIRIPDIMAELAATPVFEP